MASKRPSQFLLCGKKAALDAENMNTTELTKDPNWTALKKLQQEKAVDTDTLNLNKLFANDPGRFAKYK